ncbi:MAG: hypothetical protein MR274_08770 [Clostridium sp.]|nr:hypothetical protein [Clostridium sp.]MDY3829203.1 hypothetical protein [Clostridium sp.]
MENYIGDNWFILAIVLLIATIFIPILLFVLLFIKSGKFVKKPVGFGIVQAYSVIACVLMLIVRSERVNFAGVILGFLTIFVTVGTAFVKKYDFFVARLANAILVVFSTLAFWYTEWHVVMLFIIIAIMSLLIFLLYLQKKNNVINYKKKK